MAGRLRSHRGGITSLLELHEKFPEAVEFDLIRLGLRWRDVGSKRLSWRDALVIVNQLDEDSALARAMNPELAVRLDRWLEFISYQLDRAAVQRGNQSGAKRKDFPKPPAWVGHDDEAPSSVIGSAPLNSDEMAAFLGGAFLPL